MKLDLEADRSMFTEVKSALLHVHDLSRMAAWYAKLLGMPPQSIDAETPYYEFDMDNGINLMLDDHRSMPPDQRRGKHPICMLGTDNCEKAYAAARRAGITILQEMVIPHPGLAYFNVADSEGNAIMIVESNWVNPKPLRQLDCNHPIRNRISSIVIPVNDLSRAAEWYSKLLGQPVVPDRLDGGPVYWFEPARSNGTGILLDDNRNNRDLEALPTFMIKTEHIREAYTFMANNNITIVRDIQFDHYFIIQDPERNTVIICS